ncbi:hypothetical protein BO86DRAFT_410027 [Aspergillus japonicus CBS 114.51]|uniref:Transcription factor domain-containing protein n=1 Tax=Aspergillus japonicus CBS 114.51 TaxID=1448312 RepID=A0A8T8X0S9_ASPJA|nr:hypothetical protein BO86DRAFT_410027 [Aspergillus japonicus CBS 114.51]RAH81703.1 hypothetical protein BO86DRAFT_410027 [Aspergillus japonicus CBS 114.51]
MLLVRDNCGAQFASSVLPWRLRHQNHLNYILDALQINDGPHGRGRITRTFTSTSTVTVLNVILDLIARPDSPSPNNLATESRSKPHTYVLEYLRQAIVGYEALPPPPFSPSPPGPLDTVPLQLQSLLLERYIAMSWKTLPFQSPRSLRARLSCLFALPVSQMQVEDHALRAIMLPLLAIGSITTGYAELGEMLISEAQRNTITLYYMGDVLALQSDLLMIQYWIDSGSFESAYLRLGTTLAKILAAGLDRPTRSAHEQAVISAFCCNESLLCVVLGREAAFSSSIRHLPQSNHTIIGFMHPFYRILADIQRLHQHKTKDFMKLWNACCALRQRLLAFWSMDGPFDDSSDGENLNMGSVCKCSELFAWHSEGFLTHSTVLHYSVLILYRPFLILRALENNRDGHGDWDLNNSPAGRERVETISKGCQYSIDAAAKIISFFRRLYETEFIQKNLPLNAFFLENACYALIIDSLWGNRRSLYLSHIQTCLHCMEQTQDQPVTSSRLSITKHIIGRIGMFPDSDNRLSSLTLSQSGMMWMNEFLESHVFSD